MGSTVPVSLDIYPIPITHRSNQVSDMNKIKVIVGKGPILFAIIYLEAKVGRNIAGLDGREVVSDDLGRGDLTTLSINNCNPPTRKQTNK